MTNPQTPRRQPTEIFKASSPDEAEDTPLSLRHFISRRMQDSPSPTAPEALNPPPLREEPPTPRRGIHLNRLDTELTAGLEQYLPTPAIRLRIIKERLQTEIATAQQTLAQYSAIPTPSRAISQSIHDLQEKLAVLQRHETQIDRELAQVFSKASPFFQGSVALQRLRNRCQQVVDHALAALSPEAFVQRTDPERYRMISLNRKLASLADVLATQYDKPDSASGEISTLIHQYDQTIHQVEALAQALKQRGSFWQRLGQTLLPWRRSTATTPK